MQLPIDLPPSTSDLFGWTTCANCGKVHPQTDTHVVTHFTTDEVAEQEHTCSVICQKAWHLSKTGRLL
jgi:hypothetical protein